MEPAQKTLVEAPTTALRAAADEILGDARSILSAAPAAAPTRAIHDFRVAMKRWRALLRLLEPLVGEEAGKLRREAAALTREFGPGRDVQAACDAFADIVKTTKKHDGPKFPDDGLSDTTRRTIERRLVSLRGVAEDGALGGAAAARLMEALSRAEARIAAWPLETIAFDDLAAELAKSYRRARRRRPADWSRATDEELHELRKAVVVLRYQIETVQPLWPRMLKLFASELQRLRSQLGKANDLAVLGQFAQPRAPLARWRKPISDRAALRRKRHADRARRLAGRVFSETPRAFRRRLVALWRASQPT